VAVSLLDQRKVTEFTLQERIKPFLLAVLLSVFGAALLSVTNGNLLVIPAFCAGIAFLFLLTRYLELGIYFLLAASLLLEQFQIFGIKDIITWKIPFFLNLNLTTGIGALVFNPVEVVMGLIVALWFLRAVTSREWHLYPIPNFGIAVVFLGMLIFFTGYGLARGGNWKASLWEIRALYYLCGMYFLTSQIIRDRRQVKVCIWIILVTISIKGLQGVWRYVVTLQGDLTGIRAITGHEDALFISSVFVLMACFYFFNYRGPELKFSLAFLPTTFLTFLLAQRRVVYGTLGFSLFVVVAMLPREKKIIAAKAMAPVLVLLVLYAGAFWNSGSKLGMPVQKIKSVFVEQKGTEDESSNYYRKAELFNLKQTIRHNPFGIGFGNKYEIVMPLDKIDFPLWEYIPHNCIYWIWVKTGFIGFMIFWLFFGTAMVQAVIDYRNTKDSYFKSVGLMVLSLIVSQVIIAYYDLQITYFRNMIYLGIAMAIATTIRRTEADTPAKQGGLTG